MLIGSPLFSHSRYLHWAEIQKNTVLWKEGILAKLCSRIR